MSTTTIRLPEDLKARVTIVAKRAGTTPHNLILEAISERINQEERRGDFNELADTRYAHILATGKTISWNEMRGYLEDRLAGKTTTRPIARELAR